MTSLKFIGMVDVNDTNKNFSFDEGCIGVDRKGQLHCFTNGRFVLMCFGPKPELAIDYLYNHKEEFTSFKDIFEFVYSYSVGQHPDQVRDMMRNIENVYE